jgi:ParB-like chromosome segregation protein Spo0J
MMTAYRCHATDAKLIPLAALAAPEPADRHKVARIAGVMQRGGVFDPINVRVEGERYRVVDGKHRVRATRALSHDEIPAVISW